MLVMYPACFFKEENGYSVVFPDLDFLSTCGTTLDEAMRMAVDCLAGYLYWLELDGEKAQEPSALGNISPAAVAEELGFDYTEVFVNLVSVDVAEYAKVHFEKAVKKTLTIPAWLNKLALERDINFSGVLQEALKERLRVGKYGAK